MSDRVTLYYNSADQATAIDAVGATNALLYFSDAQTPWNLRLPEAQINKYKSKPGFDKLFGAGCLTGTSANGGHIVSFCFTPEGLIHSMFLCREPEIFN
ncbi:hypothetical protein GX865_03685 [Candidatus Saccharibacteria bacterium]|nr:hypothetical protein [Candidatus Saccharibacteria bacterium]